jgi:serine/threonine-protein kinase RsbW
MQASDERDQNHDSIVRLNIPAEYQFLSVVSAAASAILDKDQNDPRQEMLIYQIQLAIHETCTNIIEHAFRQSTGRIEVSIAIIQSEQQLVVDIYDTGSSFVLSEFQSPNLNEPNTSGYGLFIIHEMMDSVSYHPQPGRNHWRLIKHLA